MEDGNTATTPSHGGALGKLDDDDKMDIQPRRYSQDSVVRLLYPSNSTRHDTPYAVMQRRRHMARSGEAHLEAANRVFRYL